MNGFRDFYKVYRQNINILPRKNFYLILAELILDENDVDIAHDILQYFLNYTYNNLFPNEIFVLIFISLSVSIAGAERSSSKLKLI